MIGSAIYNELYGYRHSFCSSIVLSMIMYAEFDRNPPVYPLKFHFQNSFFESY